MKLRIGDSVMVDGFCRARHRASLRQGGLFYVGVGPKWKVKARYLVENHRERCLAGPLCFYGDLPWIAEQLIAEGTIRT